MCIGTGIGARVCVCVCLSICVCVRRLFRAPLRRHARKTTRMSMRRARRIWRLCTSGTFLPRARRSRSRRRVGLSETGELSRFRFAGGRGASCFSREEERRDARARACGNDHPRGSHAPVRSPILICINNNGRVARGLGIERNRARFPSKAEDRCTLHFSHAT